MSKETYIINRIIPTVVQKSKLRVVSSANQKQSISWHSYRNFDVNAFNSQSNITLRSELPCLISFEKRLFEISVASIWNRKLPVTWKPNLSDQCSRLPTLKEQQIEDTVKVCWSVLLCNVTLELKPILEASDNSRGASWGRNIAQ